MQVHEVQYNINSTLAKNYVKYQLFTTSFFLMVWLNIYQTILFLGILDIYKTYQNKLRINDITYLWNGYLQCAIFASTSCSEVDWLTFSIYVLGHI